MLRQASQILAVNQKNQKNPVDTLKFVKIVCFSSGHGSLTCVWRRFVYLSENFKVSSRTTPRKLYNTHPLSVCSTSTKQNPILNLAAWTSKEEFDSNAFERSNYLKPSLWYLSITIISFNIKSTLIYGQKESFRKTGSQIDRRIDRRGELLYFVNCPIHFDLTCPINLLVTISRKFEKTHQDRATQTIHSEDLPKSDLSFQMVANTIGNYLIEPSIYWTQFSEWYSSLYCNSTFLSS